MPGSLLLRVSRATAVGVRLKNPVEGLYFVGDGRPLSEDTQPSRAWPPLAPSALLGHADVTMRLAQIYKSRLVPRGPTRPAPVGATGAAVVREDVCKHHCTSAPSPSSSSRTRTGHGPRAARLRHSKSNARARGDTLRVVGRRCPALRALSWAAWRRPRTGGRQAVGGVEESTRVGRRGRRRRGRRGPVCGRAPEDDHRARRDATASRA